MSRFNLVVLAVAVVGLSACSTFHTPGYAVVPGTVHLLRDLHQRHPQGSVQVGAFTTSADLGNELGCRWGGKVMPAGEVTFAEYLHSALATDFDLAQVSVPSSTNVVKGSIQHLDFDSGSGHWRLAASVSAGGQPAYEIKIDLPYDTSFFADRACSISADTFVPLVQTFVKEVVTNAAFERAFADSVPRG